MSIKEIGFKINALWHVTTHADFTYSITPNTISIVDTGKASRSVTDEIEAALHKIEYWHQGSITGFKIMYRDENGVWDGSGGTVNIRHSSRCGKKDDGRATEKLLEAN